MRVCAVICEYNPFHLGHAYHLRAAREASGADYVLCLMSGALTQRGAFARHDKWLRARAALENGAAGKSGTGSTARFVQNLRDFDDFHGKEALPVVYCI